MKYDHDFVGRVRLSGFLQDGSEFPPGGSSGNFFRRGVFEARCRGVFLAIVRFYPYIPSDSGSVGYMQWKTKSTLKAIVKTDDGTLKTDACYPASIDFECESLHTHTAATDWNVKGCNGFTTAWKTSLDMQAFFIVRVNNLDRLAIFRNYIGETGVRVEFVRLAPWILDPEEALI